MSGNITTLVRDKVASIRRLIHDLMYPIVHRFGLVRDYIYRKFVHFGARYILSPKTLQTLKTSMATSPYPSLVLGILTQLSAMPMTLMNPQAALGVYLVRGFVFSCTFTAFSYSVTTFIHELRTSRRNNFANTIFDGISKLIEMPFSSMVSSKIHVEFILKSMYVLFAGMLLHQYLMATFPWYVSQCAFLSFNVLPSMTPQTVHFWSYLGAAFYHYNYLHLYFNFGTAFLACGNYEALGFESFEEWVFFMTTTGVWSNFLCFPLSLVFFPSPKNVVMGSNGMIQGLLGLVMARDFFAMCYMRHMSWLPIPPLMIIANSLYLDVVVSNVLGFPLDGNLSVAGLVCGLTYPYILQPLYRLEDSE